MRGTIPPLPKYAFVAWCYVKAKGCIYLYEYSVATLQSMTLGEQEILPELDNPSIHEYSVGSQKTAQLLTRS
jgi:hypothetical protein